MHFEEVSSTYSVTLCHLSPRYSKYHMTRKPSLQENVILKFLGEFGVLGFDFCGSVLRLIQSYFFPFTSHQKAKNIYTQSVNSEEAPTTTESVCRESQSFTSRRILHQVKPAKDSGYAGISSLRLTLVLRTHTPNTETFYHIKTEKPLITLCYAQCLRPALGVQCCQHSTFQADCLSSLF